MGLAFIGDVMQAVDQIALVRCRLDGPDEALETRYVPLREFELWRYMMEHRHGRKVTVELVSLWIAERAAWWNSGFSAEDAAPVLRLQFERRLPSGVNEPVERFFPAETYPVAQEALLSHFAGEGLRLVSATPGYFLPAPELRSEAVGLSA
jgi:hypothetical protein